MARYRTGRINDELTRALSEIMREVKDYRITNCLLSVTGVDCTPDLKYAKVFYSAVGGDEKSIADGLKAASGFIRGQLAQRLNLRNTPELKFVFDDSLKHGAHISELLRSVEEDLKNDGE